MNVLDRIGELTEQITSSDKDDWEKRADALVAMQEVFAQNHEDPSALNIDVFRVLKDPIISTVSQSFPALCRVPRF
jgi:hypothetical protein